MTSNWVSDFYHQVASLLLYQVFLDICEFFLSLSHIAVIFQILFKEVSENQMNRL